MRINIRRSIRIKVDPGLDPLKLLAGFDQVEPGVAKALTMWQGDPYYIEVDFIGVGKFKTLNQASSEAEDSGSRRELTLTELLALNHLDDDIRSDSAIFSGDFVIEFVNVGEDEESEVPIRKWRISPVSYHRGEILDERALIATTKKTRLDKGDFAAALVDFMAKPQGDTFLLAP